MFYVIKGIAYFAIGSIIGLISWVISQAYYGTSELTWMLWLMMPFGFLVSGTIAITEEVLESDRKFSAFFGQMYWFIIGGIIGMIGGALATIMGRWVFYAITENSHSILFARICGMFILGSMIGVAAGITEKFRMGSWDRCFSIILAGAFGGIFGGILRHYLTLISGKLDFLGLTIVMFGGILVLALIIVTKLRTPAVLRGHRDNFGVKYGEGFEYPLPSDVDLWIGSGMRERSSPKTRLKIYADNKVDKIQCAIGMKEEGWTLVQAPEFPRYGSHTYINDKQIKGRSRLRDGDIVTLGRTKFVFKLVSDDAAPRKQRKRGGKTLGLILFLMLSFLSPLTHAQDNSFIIVPDQKIPTGNYPEFSVPFSMIDAKSGQVLPVAIDEKSLEPSKWRVEDTDGGSLGDVISVRPVDKETEQDKLYIVLIMDYSSTMDKHVPGTSITRLEQAAQVANDFVGGVKENCYISFVPFGATFKKITPSSFMGPEQRAYLSEQIRNVRDKKSQIRRGCTALYPVLSRSVRALSEIRDPKIKKVVILLTDGYQDLEDTGCGVYKDHYHPDELDEGALTAQIREAQIPIYAFGFNLPDEKVKEEYLRSLTILSNNKPEERFFKDSGKSLRAVYDRLDNVTKAKKFILTFRTNLSPNVFVDPPDYYIFTDSFSGSYESAPARAIVQFFALPRGELEDEIRTRILTFGLAFIVICILFIAQAFMRIQMYAKVKAKESMELPEREVRSRRPQPRYSVKKMGDGRAINPEGAQVRPEGVDIGGRREDLDRPLTRPVTKPTAKPRGTKQTPAVPEKKPAGGPQTIVPGKKTRYEHVPLPEPPTTPDLPEVDTDVPDWLKGADDDEFT